MGKRSLFGLGFLAGLMPVLAWGGTPLWSFTPLTATTLTLAAGGTATVQYTLTNNSNKAHSLQMQAITGVTQVTTGGNCASPAALAGKASCTLNLTISDAITQKGGPVVCESGSAMQCYQPTSANLLNVTVTHGTSPGAFSIYSATAGNAQVALSWGASSGATNYTVKYGTTSGSYSTFSTTSSPTETVTGLTNGTQYFFKITATNGNGTTDSTNESTATPAAPAPGAFSISSATAGSAQVALAWGASSGATSYTVKYGTTSGSYSTFSTTSSTTETVTGLSNGTPYFFKITANNGAGSTDSTNEGTATPAAPVAKKIYVTAIGYTPALSGGFGIPATSIADGFCHSDANKPGGGGTYKALLATPTRTACTTANCGGGAGEHLDWVLAASTSYVRADGSTAIGTTSALGIFSFPLTSSMDGTVTTVFSGFNADWTTGVNCVDWTSNSIGDEYRQGNATATSSAAIDVGTTDTCDVNRNLVCVEQ
jgi:cellulose 1,4-beta-cellobiosidase